IHQILLDCSKSDVMNLSASLPRFVRVLHTVMTGLSAQAMAVLQFITVTANKSAAAITARPFLVLNRDGGSAGDLSRSLARAVISVICLSAIPFPFGLFSSFSISYSLCSSYILIHDAHHV